MRNGASRCKAQRWPTPAHHLQPQQDRKDRTGHARAHSFRAQLAEKTSLYGYVFGAEQKNDPPSVNEQLGTESASRWIVYRDRGVRDPTCLFRRNSAHSLGGHGDDERLLTVQLTRVHRHGHRTEQHVPYGPASPQMLSPSP